MTNLTITVQDPNGNRLPNISVTAYDGSNTLVVQGVTDSNGVYVISSDSLTQGADNNIYVNDNFLTVWAGWYDADFLYTIDNNPPPPVSGAYPHIDAIRQYDGATSTWYSIFPEGQQGQCTANALCSLDFDLKNIGTTAGTIYVKITRNDTGAVLLNQQATLSVNAAQVFNANFTMPGTNVTLTFELGHY